MKGEDKTKPAFQSVHTSMSKLEKRITGFNAAATVAFGNLAAQGIGRASAGIKNLIADTFKLNDRFHKLNISTKLSANMLSTLHHAAGFAGTEMEVLVKGFTNMVEKVGEANKGMKTYAELFEQLGIDTRAFRKLEADEQMRQFAEALSRVNVQADKLNIAKRLLGRGWQGFLTAFEQGEESLDAWIESARETGVLFDEKFFTKFADVNDDIHQMNENFRAFGNVLLVDVLPHVTKLLELMTPVLEGAGALGEWWDRQKLEGEIASLRFRANQAKNKPGNTGMAEYHQLMEEILEKQKLLYGLTPIPGKGGSGGDDDSNKKDDSALGAWEPGAAFEAAVNKEVTLGDFEANIERVSAEEKKKAKEWQEGLKDLVKEQKKTKDGFDELKYAVEGWSRSFADAIVEGKGNFKDLITTMIKETAKFYIAQSLNRAAGMGNLSKSGHSPLVDLGLKLFGSFFGGATAGPNAIAAASTTAHSGLSGAMAGTSGGIGFGLSTGINRVPRTAYYPLHEGEGIVSNAGGPGHMGGGKKGRMKQDMRPINIVLPTTVYGSGDGSFIDSFARQKQAATNLVLDELRRMRVL